MRRRHQGFDSDSDEENGGRPRLLASYQQKQQAPPQPPQATAPVPPSPQPPTSTSSEAPVSEVPNSNSSGLADATAASLEALEPLSALLKDALVGMDSHVREMMHKAVEEHNNSNGEGHGEHEDEGAEDLEGLSEEEFDQHLATLQRDMDSEYTTLKRLVEQRTGYLHAQRHAWEVYKSRIDPENDSPETSASLEREIAEVLLESKALTGAITEQQQYLERISKRNHAEEEYMVQEINHLRFRHQKHQEQLQRRAA